MKKTFLNALLAMFLISISFLAYPAYANFSAGGPCGQQHTLHWEQTTVNSDGSVNYSCYYPASGC